MQIGSYMLILPHYILSGLWFSLYLCCTLYSIMGKGKHKKTNGINFGRLATRGTSTKSSGKSTSALSRISSYFANLFIPKRKRIIPNRNNSTKSQKTSSLSRVSSSFKTIKILLILAVIGGTVLFVANSVAILQNYRTIHFTNPFKDALVRSSIPYNHAIDLIDTADIDTVNTTLLFIEAPLRQTHTTNFVTDDAAESYIQHVYLNIWNEDTGSGSLICIPGWVYYSSYATGVKEPVEVNDMLYVAQEVRGDRMYAVAEIEKWLGIDIDSYILVDAEGRHFIDSIFGQTQYNDDPVEFIQQFTSSISPFKLITNSDNVENLSAGIHSNMGPIALYEEIERIDNLAGGKSLTVIDLSDENYHISDVSQAGTEIKLININEFDKALSSHYQVLRSRIVEKEQAKVEVYNSSAISGFAGEVGRRIQNTGVKLLRSGNSPMEYNQTTIYVSNLEKYPNSLSIVKAQLDRAILGATALGTDSKSTFKGEIRILQGRPDFLTTGDIVVIIGSDVVVK